MPQTPTSPCSQCTNTAELKEDFSVAPSNSFWPRPFESDCFGIRANINQKSRNTEIHLVTRAHFRCEQQPHSTKSSYPAGGAIKLCPLPFLGELRFCRSLLATYSYTDTENLTASSKQSSVPAHALSTQEGSSPSRWYPGGIPPSV